MDNMKSCTLAMTLALLYLVQDGRKWAKLNAVSYRLYYHYIRLVLMLEI